jgi:hypothetical protein
MHTHSCGSMPAEEMWIPEAAEMNGRLERAGKAQQSGGRAPGMAA